MPDADVLRCLSSLGVLAHFQDEWPHWLQFINDDDTFLWGRIHQTKVCLAQSRCSVNVCFKNCTRATALKYVQLNKPDETGRPIRFSDLFALSLAPRGLCPCEELKSTAVLSFIVNLSLWKRLASLILLTLLLIFILQRRHYCFMLFIYFSVILECLQAPFPAFNYVQGH